MLLYLPETQTKGTKNTYVAILSRNKPSMSRFERCREWNSTYAPVLPARTEHKEAAGLTSEAKGAAQILSILIRMQSIRLSLHGVEFSSRLEGSNKD